MPLVKVSFTPGINRESTAYANEQGWYDSDLIRFRKGRPEKIGGWTKLSGATISGTVRSLFTWAALNASKLMSVGTDSKFYIEEGGKYNDLTPLRSTTTGTATFSATNGSATLTVTDASHGASAGDSVTFNSAASLGGNITAAVLNQEYEIQTVPSANTYTITATATANASDSGTGGGSTVAQYQLNISLVTSSDGIGFGAGTFSGLTSPFSETTLNGAIADSATSIILTSASLFETASTSISANVSIDATGALTVADASGLPDQGTIKIGSENIIYASKSGNVLNDLGRGADGTTAAAHSSSASVTFVGIILIDQELIQYTGKSSNTLDAGVVRAARGTTAVAHSDGAAVKEANAFVFWGGVAVLTTTDVVRLWSADNWGEDLIFCVVNGTPYYWDKTLGLNTRATDLASQTGASDAPTITRQILVSGADRHVIALGSNPIGETVQDPLMVRWSDKEAPFDWTPTATNTAGSQRLSAGSEIVTGIKTRQETLILTDTSLYSMRFVGPPFTFSFALVSNNVSTLSTNTIASVGDKVFWMDLENFYAYTGRLQTLPCTVLRYVFDDINLEQTTKFFAAPNRLFDEIFFFYVSSDAVEIDRYVKFNYTEGTWDIGTLSRTAWVDAGIHPRPRGAGIVSDNSYVFIHENGDSDDGSTMNSYIESSDFDLQDGNNFMFVSKIIPDIAITGTDAEVSYTLKTRDFPSEAAVTEATTSVLATTKKADVRCRGRTGILRISSDSITTAWTLGETRLDLRPDGRR